MKFSAPPWAFRRSTLLGHSWLSAMNFGMFLFHQRVTCVILAPGVWSTREQKIVNFLAIPEEVPTPDDQPPAPAAVPAMMLRHLLLSSTSGAQGKVRLAEKVKVMVAPIVEVAGVGLIEREFMLHGGWLIHSSRVFYLPWFVGPRLFQPMQLRRFAVTGPGNQCHLHILSILVFFWLNEILSDNSIPLRIMWSQNWWFGDPRPLRKTHPNPSIVGSIWVFPKIVVPPKHPKMIIFSRKTHGCWVPPFSETPI